MKQALVLFLLFSNSLFAQVNLNQGLVAYYPFNGNANDASGNNNNPVFNNATLTADRFGNPNSAYSFNGIDNYIQIPNSPSLNPTNQMSICAWVKVSGFYQGPCHGNNIVMKGDADYLPGNYVLRFDDSYFTNNTNCSIPAPDQSHESFFGVQSGQLSNSPFIQTNQWYSVVFTCDGITAKTYVNCQLVGLGPANGITFSNGYDLFLGRLNDPQFPYWFNGTMDEVRIYNRALNDDEIKAYGDCTTTTVDTIINNYTPVLAFNPCDNKITVEDASAFNIGDTVLMIQMKGAVIDSSNSSTFGIVTNYKNAGNYEFNYVKSKSGNVIEFKNGLTRQYDALDGKTQLVRVPYYQNVTFNSNLTCLPWDGSKGGIVVLNVQNTLTLNANIDVSGKGFKGGVGYNSQNNTLDCFENNFSYPITANANAAMKGESIAAISDNIICGKGSPAGGGGGGLGHNSGGGGGGNGGSGGFGGYQLDACGNSPFDNRGIGGHTISYTTSANKIFLGSGGGAGHSDNNGNLPNSGGNGGGIIIINADKLKTNNYKIMSNGSDGVPCSMPPSTDCHDGMGGGGSGGSILLNINQLLDNSITENKGGKGADMIGSVALGHRIGAGGGGGGGMLFLKSNFSPANLTNINSGGANGVLTTDNNNPYGATPGQNGTVLFNLQIPIDSVLFKTNIDSVKIRDSATSCTSFNFNALSYTNTNPITSWQWDFTDGTTASVKDTTHFYTSSGAHAVKLIVADINGCKDSISQNVISNQPSFDFNYRLNACDPLSVQFIGIGNDTLNPYWSFGDATTITGNLNPIHSYFTTGNYNVRYSVTNGTCTDTITKTISVSVTPKDLILTSDTTICFGASKLLMTKPVLNFCWNPVTYLSDPNSPNPITSTPQNITYYFTAQVTGTNLITNGDFSNGNTSFISEYHFANPNVTEGEYFVGSSPSAWNTALSNCVDHTTGNGKMLLVNGSPAPDINVWKQTVTVTPNTNYAFSTWIQALWPPNPAQLQFSINGQTIGNLITASLPTCTWSQFYTTWNSGANTTATISIVNKNTQILGNDFALDDIAFAPVFIEQDSVTISVEKPVINASKDTAVCSNAQVSLNATGTSSYSWSPSTGLNNSNIANPMAAPNSTTQYIVTGTTLTGCIAKDTVNITVYPNPVISKSIDTIICKNSSAQLFASGGISFSWSPSISLNNNLIANPVATPATNTLYHVTVIDGNNCANSDSIRVSIRPDPVFAISNPSNICLNNSIQLNASGGNSYSWQPSTSLSNSSISNPTASPMSTTIYSVLIKDTVCNNSTNLATTITVFSLPVITVDKSNDLDCSHDFSQLNATGGSKYEWSPTTTLNNPTIANPVAHPTSPTLYIVKVSDANGCVNYDSVMVNITDFNKSGYFMPNAFTPNNDGLNDCYGIKFWGVIQELDFGIYNRWGERIFHTSNPGDCWDGTYKGVQQDPGVYVYLITAKTFCGKVFKKGTFVLIR